MVLINNLTIDEINAALIALQRTKETTQETGVSTQTQSQQAQQNTSNQELNSIKERIADNTRTNENQARQITELFSLVSSVGNVGNIEQQVTQTEIQNQAIQDVYFDTPTRILYIVTVEGETYSCTIPEGTVINENYIYDPNDNLRRLKMDINGITAQKGTRVGNEIVWEDLGTIGIDRFGSIILNNTDTVLDYGVKVNGSIYHFDNNGHLDYDEQDTNPEDITVDGERVTTNGTSPILYSSYSPYCVEGTVEKDISSFEGSVVFFTKSDGVIVGNKVVKEDGRIEDWQDLSSLNAAMRNTSSTDPTKTVGEYVGLTPAQVQQGIFN